MASLWEHPSYIQHREEYRVIRDLYENHHRVLSGPEYLFRHVFERKPDKGGETLLRARIERTRFLALLKIAVEIWKGMLFQNRPDIPDAVAELLGDEIDNIDGFGNSLYSFIKDRVFTEYILMGRVGVLVDSLQDAPDNRPFMDVITADSLKDWQDELRSNSRFGNFDFVRFEYYETPKRASHEDEPFYVLKSDALYLNEDGYFTVQRYKATEERPKELEGEKTSRYRSHQQWEREGEELVSELRDHIPFFILEGESWLSDAAQEALRFHNLRSNYDSVNYFQGSQKIFVKGIDSDNKQAVIDLAEYAVGNLGNDPNADVIAVESVESSGLQNALVASLDTFFKMALKNLRTLPLDSRESQSADAQSQERRNQKNIIHSCIDDLENFMNRALKTYAAFKGVEDFQEEINLNRDIEIDAVETQVLIYQTLKAEIQKLPKWERSVLIRFLKLQNFSEKEFDEIKDEIEQMPETPRRERPSILERVQEATLEGTEDTEEPVEDAEQAA